MSAAESGVSPTRTSFLPISTRNLILAYQSFGVVYGDLCTSPLYVYPSTFIGKQHNEEAVFGAFSLIFWTLTLIPLLKYLLVLTSAHDNGQGAVCLLLLLYLSSSVCHF